ncbi:NADH-quinone oxidoreductase subunit L [Buchnera aphidicola]|uniref:NADH-quinone oxidoreductase subunit L n=1 Tax=Buchnera aphidicola TaxID=9 RepID=UPI003464710A
MNFIYLTILIPFLSFFILLFFSKKFKSNYICFFGVVSIFISFLITLKSQFYFLSQKQLFYEIIYFKIIKIQNININLSFLIDQLSLTMLEIINGVGFLISIFSIWYFKNEKKCYLRFFIYVNLFISSMCFLVLSNNFFMIYCGWELVGFCSYLLIGFYYYNNKNINSAVKAFFITKIGDFFLLFGIFIIYYVFNTLNLKNLIELVQNNKIVENIFLFKVALYLISIGACAKSAQFPFHNWLLLAMAGPSPVSALIHAATMITAGVYLITRLRDLISFFPEIFYFLSFIGVLTLIFSSFLAIFEKNIKKILAYSTISQLGYMFLAMGFKLWNIVIFHLSMHSFFKSLLFLSSGSLIILSNYQKNIFKMQFKKIKNIIFIFLVFLIGGLSLISFPLFSSSFYTKGAILWNIFLNKEYLYFSISVLGSFFTSIYFFRMIFLLLFNNLKYIKFIKIKHFYEINFFHNFSLLVLSILSTVLGLFFIYPILDSKESIIEFSNSKKNFLEIFLSLISISGIFLSYFIYFKKNIFLKNIFYCKYLYFSYIKIRKLFKFIIKSIICFFNFSLNILNFLIYFFLKKILFLFSFIFNFIHKFFLKIEINFLNWYILLIFSIFVFIILIEFIFIKF